MENNILIKNELEEYLYSLAQSEAIYLDTNIKEIIDEICTSLNSNQSKATVITGFHGTGKTSLTNLILKFTHESIIKCNIDCSSIFSLDDLILKIYLTLLKNNTSINRIKAKAIDEKLLSYLSQKSRKIFLVLDNFNLLLDDNSMLKSDDILHFLQHFLSIQSNKLILTSTNTPDLSEILPKELTEIIRIYGFDENQSIEYLRLLKININPNLTEQIYSITKGYQRNLKLLAEALRHSGISLFDLIKNHAEKNENLELFLFKILYKNLSAENVLILKYLSSFAHSINIQTLNFIFKNDFSKLIYELKQIGILQIDDENIFLPSTIKKYIYENIAVADKIKIHSELLNLYNQQIPLKPTERKLTLSRETIKFLANNHSLLKKSFEHKFSTIANESIYGKSYSHKSDLLIKKTNETIINDLPIESNEQMDLQEEIHSFEYLPDIEINDENIESFLTEEEKVILSLDKGDEDTNNDEVATDTDYYPETEGSQEEQILSLYKNNEFDNALKHCNDLIKSQIEQTDVYKSNMLLAKIMISKGDLNNALKTVRNCIKYYQESGDGKNLIKAKILLAEIYFKLYHYKEAINTLNELLKEKIENKKSLYKIYRMIGAINHDSGKYTDALQNYLTAFNGAVELNDNYYISQISFEIGLAYDDINDKKNACKYYLKNIEIYEKNNIKNFTSDCYYNLADIYFENNDYKNCLNHYFKSLKIDEENDNITGKYNTYSKIAGVYLQINNNDKYFLYLNKKLTLAKKLGNKMYITTSYLDIGNYYHENKIFDKAIKSYILAQKNITGEISTDTKNKINTKIKKLIKEIGTEKYKDIIENIRKNNV